MKKHVLSLVMLLSACSVSGCAVAFFGGFEAAEPPKEECRLQERRVVIFVTSAVNDAEIYVDGKRVGSTRTRKVPVAVGYQICRNYKTFPTRHSVSPWRITNITVPRITIQKAGYQTCEVNLVCTGVGERNVKLERDHFEVKLEP